MLDKSFVESIGTLKEESLGVQITEAPKEPSGAYWIKTKDGNPERIIPLANPFRTHAAGDLDTLADLADEAMATGKRPEFWYSRSLISLVIDPFERRHIVKFPLAISPQLATLAKFEANPTPHNQQKLIKVLKTTFHDSLIGTDLMDLLRRVVVSVNTDSEQTATRRNLGKDAEARLGEGKVLPEFLDFKVPVFASGSLSSVVATVRCDFELDPSGGTAVFYITPCAGKVESAISSGEVQLAGFLSSLMKARGRTSGDGAAATYGLYLGSH